MSDIPPSQPPSGFSNYPRATNYYDPNARPPGVYFDTIGQAWDLVKRELSVWVASVLFGGILAIAISVGSSFGVNMIVYGAIIDQGPFSLPRYILTMVIGIIPNAVAGTFHSSLLYMGVKQARGEPIVVGDVFKGFTCFLPLVGATILTSLAYWAGFICLIVPGIFWSAP